MIVIKLGGNALAASADSGWLHAVVGAYRENKRIVLVHGGGPQIDSELKLHDIPKVVVDGFRVTSSEAFEIVEMVLAGQVQQKIVRSLRGAGIPAVGITGSDGGLFDARKKMSKDGNDLGKVGEISRVDPKIIETLWNVGFLPVLSPVSSDPAGDGYTVNADLAAGALAGALKVDKAIFMTDVKGIYRNYPDEATLIKKTTLAELSAMMHTFSAGMLPKVEAVKLALESGAKTAYVIDGRETTALSDLLSGQEVGTEIVHG